MVKVGRYDYKRSTRPNKKLMVKVDGKTIHFGSRAMGHFKDKTGIWSSKNHNDPKRRKNFLARSGGILNKKGQRTATLPSSPNYHARRVLW
jgi:hypothetical protein